MKLWTGLGGNGLDGELETAACLDDASQEDGPLPIKDADGVAFGDAFDADGVLCLLALNGDSVAGMIRERAIVDEQGVFGHTGGPRTGWREGDLGL